MAEKYVPELGQMVFGQPHQEFGVPDIWEAALRSIASEIERVMWNLTQKEYSTPFENSGAVWCCDTFKAVHYSWGDDPQPYNFKWRDIEISWYKYLGRGMSANKQLLPQEASDCLVDCLKAIREIETMGSSYSEEYPEGYWPPIAQDQS